MLVLKISRTEKEEWYFFELIDEVGNTLTCDIKMSEQLMTSYRKWKKEYDDYYSQTLGIVESVGGGKLNNNNYGDIAQAKKELIDSFNEWLNQPELLRIRTAIVTAIVQAKSKDFYIACDSWDIHQFPWEHWQIPQLEGKRLKDCFNVKRTSMTYDTKSISMGSSWKEKHRGKLRILVIIGYDRKQLNSDENPLKKYGDEIEETFKNRADVTTYICFDKQTTGEQIKKDLSDYLHDPLGWDMIFVVSHGENSENGGRIKIGPSVWIEMGELEGEWQSAIKNGLRAVCFIACNGINMGDYLVSLGVNHVIVMREKIAYEPAKLFLRKLTELLYKYIELPQAFKEICVELEQTINVKKYPSVYLIPSLYSYPGAPPFRVQPPWYYKFRQWKPSGKEVAALIILSTLSLLHQVQDSLLQPRLLTQAIYAHSTNQDNYPVTPILIVRINEDSLAEGGITQKSPIDRRYMAKIVEKAITSGAKVIALDYIFDRPQKENDPYLAKTITEGITKHGIRFLLPSHYDSAKKREIGLSPAVGIPRHNQILQGNVDGYYPLYNAIPTSNQCPPTCPFSYLMAQLYQTLSPSLPPQENRKFPSVGLIVNDFSIPPSMVYQTISAKEFLANPSNSLPSPLVLISADGYPEAGITTGGDKYPLPWVMRFWQLYSSENFKNYISGGETNAYNAYQILHHRLIPIFPTLPLILLAAWWGKATVIFLKIWSKNGATRYTTYVGLFAGTVFYGVITLQLYAAGVVLLPWLLPSMTYLTYVYLVDIQSRIPPSQ